MSIEEHDFDSVIKSVVPRGDVVEFSLGAGNSIYFSKRDAYALAKHFGLIDEWVSVDTEPEIGQEVLILIDIGGNIERGKYIGNGEFTGNWCSRRGKGYYYQVTYWKPRPQLPKEQTK